MLRTIASATLLSLLFLYPTAAVPQNSTDIEIAELIQGHWVINEELSDNTDDKVEAAIKADGGRIRRNWFSKKVEDRYRGGPADQELYDRISYDDVLRIQYNNPEFIFEYADNYKRIFHSDERDHFCAQHVHADVTPAPATRRTPGVRPVDLIHIGDIDRERDWADLIRRMRPVGQDGEQRKDFHVDSYDK